jgi:hypothetical protein
MLALPAGHCRHATADKLSVMMGKAWLQVQTLVWLDCSWVAARCALQLHDIHCASCQLSWRNMHIMPLGRELSILLEAVPEMVAHQISMQGILGVAQQDDLSRKCMSRISRDSHHNTYFLSCFRAGGRRRRDGAGAADERPERGGRHGGALRRLRSAAGLARRPQAEGGCSAYLAAMGSVPAGPAHSRLW